MSKISNSIFCPQEVLKGLTDKKSMLISGMLFVGFSNTVTLLLQHHNKIFADISSIITLRTIILTLLIIAVYGFIDVILFTLPMYNLFRRFPENDSDSVRNPSIIKVAKVYVIPHIILFPFNFAFIMIIKDMTSINTGTLLILEMLIIWFCYIIARGIKTIFNIKSSIIWSFIIFIVVYIWTSVFSVIAQSFISPFILGLLL
jgi:hypothetical protein